MEFIKLDSGFQAYRTLPSSSPSRVVFFAHANGIAAPSYRRFFTLLADRLNAVIYSYDMRGIGRSQEIDPSIHATTPSWSWELLALDHCYICDTLSKMFPSDFEKPLISMGHSLGGWITLMTSYRMKTNIPVLLDPPVLPFRIILQWTIAVIFGQRQTHVIGKKAKKRKKFFKSESDVVTSYSYSRLMKNWPKESIEDYVRATFEEREDGCHLRHKVDWEVHLFESMPISTLHGLSHIPRHFRQAIPYTFIVGENSDACNPKAGGYMRFLLKRASWNILKKGHHMFPMEAPDETVALIHQAISHL